MEGNFGAGFARLTRLFQLRSRLAFLVGFRRTPRRRRIRRQCALHWLELEISRRRRGLGTNLRERQADFEAETNR